MDTLLFFMMAALELGWGPARDQDGTAPILRSEAELPFPCHDLCGDPESDSDLGLRAPNLWYGTPGVRPGGDLLGPIMDLVKRPSGLIDFKPWRVPAYLPDRDTAEFLHERR